MSDLTGEYLFKLEKELRNRISDRNKKYLVHRNEVPIYYRNPLYMEGLKLDVEFYRDLRNIIYEFAEMKGIDLADVEMWETQAAGERALDRRLSEAE